MLTPFGWSRSHIVGHDTAITFLKTWSPECGYPAPGFWAAFLETGVLRPVNRLRQALALTTADRYFSLAANFVTLVLISRILSPAEIGISVTGMAVVGIALSVREFASMNFLIQRADLSRDDIRSAFTVMLAATLLLAGILAVAAPFVAEIYSKPGLDLFLHMAALAIVLEVPAAPIVGLMRRDMAFGRVMMVNAMTAGTNACVTVTLAVLGFSYMSIAWGLLCGTLAGGLLALWLGGKLWMFKPIFRNWHGMLVFGGYNGFIVVLFRLYEQLPYLFLGRILSFNAVALFNRGLMVCQMPDKILLGGATAVILPAFSEEARQNRDLKAPYLAAISFITSLQWPALVVLSILAHPVVHIVLGQGWGEAVPLVRVIAIATMFSFTFELTYPVLVATGAIRDAFVRAVLTWPISAVVLLSVAFFGLKAMVFSLLVIVPFQAVISLLLIARKIPMTVRELLLSVWKSSIVTLATAAGPLLVVAWNRTFEIGLLMTAIALLAAATCWLVSIWAIGHPVFDEVRRLAGHLAGMRRARQEIPAAGNIAVQLERPRNG